ncbi:MAG: NUMOD3 domain-containing DNA-binding protein [Bacteroidales bacterium]|jgi:hypothetical protein
MSTTFKPYTYLIGWSTLNKFYYGVQYGKKANPDNLWNIYFTSSKYVKEFRELYGEPDIIQIRKVFETKEQAIQWEFKVIQRMHIVQHNKWLNRSLNGQKFFNNGHTEETKQKLSNSLQGHVISEETKQKLSNSLQGHVISEETKKKIGEGNRGKIVSEESRKKMSKTRKGKIRTQEHSDAIVLGLKNSNKNKGINNWKFGKPWDEETKQRISESNKNQQKFECPHCKGMYIKSNFNRWHNDNCKLKE